MSNHTQGPWIAMPIRYYDRIQLWGTSVVTVVNKDGDSAVSCILGNSPETNQANAALIVAAPTLKAENEALRAVNAEMVEALKNLLMTVRNWVEDELGDGGGGWEVYARFRPSISRARAIIAKTEGKDTT